MKDVRGRKGKGGRRSVNGRTADRTKTVLPGRVHGGQKNKKRDNNSSYGENRKDDSKRHRKGLTGGGGRKKHKGETVGTFWDQNPFHPETGKDGKSN